MKQKKFPQTEASQILSRSEILKFRKRLKQRICVELLQDGYHKSFSELFTLLALDEARRAAAEPDSADWLQLLLEEQPDKMEALKLHLRQAEQAENSSSWTCVCEQRLLLGQFFSSPQDSSLALHFLHSCAERERGGSSGPATEARVCLGEVYLQRGELKRARQQVQLCISQADEGGWLDSSHRPLSLRARGVMWRICSQQAEALQHQDRVGALALLHEGHRAATESENQALQSEACYQLGLAYQNARDHNKAQKFLKSCLQMYTVLQDADGIGKCYKAMASEGDTEDTIKCLKKMANIYRNSGQQRGLVDALLCLGNIYFKMSQYMRACEYFVQSCELSCKFEDPSLLEKAQVSLASARALSLIGEHRADVEASSSNILRRLVARKETRGLPPPSPEALPSPGPEALPGSGPEAHPSSGPEAYPSSGPEALSDYGSEVLPGSEAVPSSCLDALSDSGSELFGPDAQQ